MTNNVFLETAHLAAPYDNLSKGELFKSQLPVA